VANRYPSSDCGVSPVGLGWHFVWLCPSRLLHGAPYRLLDTVSRLNTLKYAAPAQMVREEAGGDTVKASHPTLQSAVVGINVLNVESPCRTHSPGREWTAG
jgi:hypothetical protein